MFDRMFVMLDERSVGRIVAALGFSHISVRPRNPRANEHDQEAHKKTYGPPRLQAIRDAGLISLRQRIRSQGSALAKMEIRTSRSS
jgi:hypothetical protein